MPYTSRQDVVDKLRPGWRITGQAPTQGPNPDAGKPGQPATIAVPGRTTLTIDNPNDPTATPDEIVIKEVGNADTKGGVGYDVEVGPQKAQPKPPATASPQTSWVRIGANGQQVGPNDPAVAIRDPNAPPGTQPWKLEDDQQLGDPSTWQTVYADPTGQDKSTPIGLYDPKTKKLAATIPASAGTKDSDPSGWSPVYRVPGDTKSGIVGQYDPVNKSLHPVAAAPDGKQIVTTDTGIYVVDKDTGKSTLSTTIDKNSPVQVVTYPDGSIYTYDPNQKSLTKLQGTQPPATITQTTPGGNVTLTYDPESKSYKVPPGTQVPSTVDAPGAAALEYIVYRDANGNEISRSKNPNYRPTQTTQGAQSTTSRQIQQWNAKTGQWEWVENQGRVVASDALRDMATKLTGQVVAGDISEDEATKLITAANAKMANDIAQQNAAADAAKSVLTSTAQSATTGAGMLNQRVSSATGALNSMMSSMAGSNMQNLPAGTGAQLVRGLGSWVTGLGGGDATYDAAARMVQAADPKVSGDPNVAQQATQALSQMFQEYQRQNGKPAPQVAATIAAQQSTQANGMTAPPAAAPLPTPTPVVQPANVASGQMAPAGGLVPGQNYGPGVGYGVGFGGTMPWAGATPQPLPPGTPIPFIAPAMA
jgi:hypothetical protein